MAIVKTGDDLTVPILQPGGKVTDDGYGLMTATCEWKADETFDPNESIGIRGSTCPLNANLYSHKYGITYDKLGIATITVDYIGINPDVNEGLHTNPQVTASNGLTSEHITTHPNFFVDGGEGYVGDPIAGTSYTQSALGPMVEIKSPSDFVEVVTGYNSDGTPITGLVSKKQSYVGNNGACFESSAGGRFIGFVDPNYKHFYGRTNYLAPQTSFSGHFYTTEDSDVQHMIRFLGTTSYDNDWAGTMPNIVPIYAGTDFKSSAANGEFDQLLLAQVNVEDYGLLYKVNYEVRFSVQGWHPAVYRKSSVMP